MKSIENREDIFALVNRFYGKIRKDELLGPIFTGRIPKDKWAIHLSKLTDFWEFKLLGIRNFNGNPTRQHISVDQEMNHTMVPAHFEAWLKLWFETLDKMYEGELANRAKIMANNMAKGQFSQVVNHRPTNKE